MLHWPKKSLVMPFYYINFDQNGPPYFSVAKKYTLQGGIYSTWEDLLRSLFSIDLKMFLLPHIRYSARRNHQSYQLIVFGTDQGIYRPLLGPWVNLLFRTGPHAWGSFQELGDPGAHSEVMGPGDCKAWSLVNLCSAFGYGEVTWLACALLVLKVWFQNAGEEVNPPKIGFRRLSWLSEITIVILLHEKFLQFDWLRAVVFQLNLKYLHVKITTFCG